MSEEQTQYARGFVDSLDWGALLELARKHRLFPLLYWHWTKSLQLSFPAGLAPQLDDWFRANAARSLLLAQELAQVVERLGRFGIPAVPFKGPALAEKLYGNAALRECVDLDILIRRRDVANAIQTLVSAGYVDGKQLTAARQTAYIGTQYEYPLLSPSGVLVELQWRIVPHYFSLPLEEEQYWSRMQPMTIRGREMNSLSPEDQPLFLCIHGGKHGWQKLIWLADVAEMVVSHPVDWEYVLDQAQRAGALRMVLLGVFLANRLLGTTVPADIEDSLARDPMVEHIAEALVGNLVSGRHPTYLESQRYFLRVRERWQDRLRYLVRFTSTPTPMEWEMVRLPPALSGLYRVVRLLRGLGKAVAIAGSTVYRLVKA